MDQEDPQSTQMKEKRLCKPLQNEGPSLKLDSDAIISNPTDQVEKAQTLSLNPEETIQQSIGNELVFNWCQNKTMNCSLEALMQTKRRIRAETKLMTLVNDGNTVSIGETTHENSCV